MQTEPVAVTLPKKRGWSGDMKTPAPPVYPADAVDAFLTSLGIGLVIYVFGLFALSTLLFALGVPVWSGTLWFVLPGSSALASALAMRAGLSWRIAIASGMCTAALVLAAAGLSSLVYDLSWDGIAYHQEAVIQLAQGWNPFSQHLADEIGNSIWINHYPKLTWIFGASHYAAFGNIEAGKCYSIILAVATLCLLFSLVRTSMGQHWTWAFLIALLAVSNPIVINQLFNYYLDGALYLLFVLVAVSGILALSGRGRLRWYLLYCVAGTLLVNIKFTGVPYFCLIASTIGVFLIVNRGLRDALGFGVLSLAVFLFAFFLFGYDSYAMNLAQHGHPFYPLYGQGALDILSGNTPPYYEGRGALERFLLSIFHVVSNNREAPLELRLPFLLNSWAELDESVGHDIRFSGFGFWFSGIFVTSIIALIYVITRGTARFSRRDGSLVILALLVTVMINPGAWWARYVPQLWLLPVIATLMLRAAQGTTAHLLNWFMVAIMVVNSAVVMRGVVFYNYYAGSQVRDVLAGLRASASPVPIHFGPFPALRVRLSHAGIAYTAVPHAEDLPCSDRQWFPHSYYRTPYCPPR